MNQLPGIITSIESDGNISLITIEAAQTLFSSLVIDTPDTASYLKTGNSILIAFKETEMSIGKALTGELSTRNKFAGTIKAVEQGKILTKVHLDFKGHNLYSVITTQSARSMQLKAGDQVEGLVKTNEISLMEKTV